ncbi:MAG: alpha/beta hydrolase [Pseudomonadota bacterium]
MIKIFFWIVVLYLAFVATLYVMQWQMIYFPSKTVEDLPTIKDVSVVKTRAQDGIDLNGWYVAPKDEKPVFVFFHGNASSHSQSFFRMFTLIDEGYGFLSVGYRGYGGNRGRPSEDGFYKDSRAFINLLKSTGLAEDQIILYGQSIGTGPAIQMATEYPDIKAVILESPYTSLPDVAAQKYFFVPVHQLMKDKFDNLSKISKVSAPILFIHGESDRLIPISHSEELLAATKSRKKLIRLPNISHNNIPSAKLADDIVEFISHNQ